MQMEEQTSDKSLEDRSGYGKALIWAIPVLEGYFARILCAFCPRYAIVFPVTCIVME